MNKERWCLLCFCCFRLKGWRMADKGIEQLTRLLPTWADLRKIRWAERFQEGDNEACDRHWGLTLNMFSVISQTYNKCLESISMAAHTGVSIKPQHKSVLSDKLKVWGTCNPNTVQHWSQCLSQLKHQSLFVLLIPKANHVKAVTLWLMVKCIVFNRPTFDEMPLYGFPRDTVTSDGTYPQSTPMSKL